ncbi:hypothetical protein [Sedimenticola sp.]|uniref:hypothetical protein n=1 Tax=Sedimenticola sp. TaxID=1940285 RepID=UPI003D11710A
MKGTALILLVCLFSSGESLAWEAPPTFQVCTDYHCDILKPVTLDAAQWQALRALFSSTRSAAQERQQIRTAIAWMEQQVGEQAGTWVDLKENDGEGSEPGQLDCIAESINTTTYLRLMAQDNLLKWHQVQERQRRNPWLFDIHWTATIWDTQTQQRYAIDSWFFANGEPPVVQPIEAWLSGQDFTLN